MIRAGIVARDEGQQAPGQPARAPTGRTAAFVRACAAREGVSGMALGRRTLLGRERLQRYLILSR